MDASDLRLAWLQGTPGLGPSVLRRVVDLYGGCPPEGIVGRSAAWYAAEWEVRSALAECIARQMSACPAAVRAASALPIRLCTPHDPAYPAGLRRLAAPPPVVTLAGADVPAGACSFAVVASRGADAESGPAIKAAWEAGLAAGWAAVAGHNRAVYQWGLLAAKRAASPAVMVLDRGLLAAFDDDLRRDPVPAARIWGFGFDTERSLAVSPFRLHDGYIGRNNVLRDEMVFALADVIVAVSVREGGGMQRLCERAVARGQALFAHGEAYGLLAGKGARKFTTDGFDRVSRPEVPGNG